jgi:GNAT superfamily N-acetyltransferase
VCQDALVSSADVAGGSPAGSSSLVIRDRTEGDLDGCVRLLAEVHRRDGYPVNWPGRPAAWLAGSREIAAWVAIQDGRLAGHASLWRSGGARDADGTALVSRLFVAPAARGRGIGAALLSHVTRQARRRGLRLVLEVDAASEAAEFYQALGWRPMGDEHQWWGSRRVRVSWYAAPD